MVLLRNCFGKYISANSDGTLTCEDQENAGGFEVINKNAIVVGQKNMFKNLNSKYIVLKKLTR